MEEESLVLTTPTMEESGTTYMMVFKVTAVILRKEGREGGREERREGR